VGVKGKLGEAIHSIIVIIAQGDFWDSSVLLTPVFKNAHSADVCEMLSSGFPQLRVIGAGGTGCDIVSGLGAPSSMRGRY
jgi:hypothetical protein